MDGPAVDVVGAYEVECEKRVQSAKWTHAVSSDGNCGSGGPKYAGKVWLTERIVEQESADKKRNSSEYKVILENGISVFRWPSKPGVKIRKLFLSEGDNATYVLHTNRQCSINMELEVEIDGKLACRYFFSIFNLEALRLVWITSPIDHFVGVKGGVRKVVAQLTPLLLGGGRFILSASIFDDTDLKGLSSAARYDLLARCMEFQVIEDDGRESPVFHHPAIWQMEPKV
jgi:hypothetical protein